MTWSSIALSNGRGPIGTANPVLYAIGKTRGTTADVYKTSFNDITQDPNDTDEGVDTFVSVRDANGKCLPASDSNTVAFAAGDGYDLATGWGSPKLGLIAQLASTSPAPVSEIAAGDFHACAVRSGGTVSCWGLNDHGQLGNGATSQWGSNAAQTVLNLTNAWQISAGGYHTCAVTKGGSAVYCWGGNDGGQLGLGGSITADQTSPALVPGLTNVIQIAAGERHTCAIVGPPPLTLKCWGNNTNGQVGDGTTTSRFTPVVIPTTSPPAQVALGGSHSCALLADGTVACWGANSHGQLGIDSTTEKHTPQVVKVPSDYSPAMLVAGANHTCMNASYGTDGDSEIFCWGDNSLQQLGTGPETEEHAPTAVRYWGTGVAMGFAGLAAGGNHTCALQLDRGTPGGKVAGCWGDNRFGELGIGNTTSPGGVIALYSLANVATIVAGSASTYVLTTAGAVGAWGGDFYGQLGDKQNIQQNSPEMITLF